jgi:hypothetical protein
MKFRWLWLGFAIIAVGPGRGADTQPIGISPHAVFVRYLQALGGVDAVSRVHTAHIKVEAYPAKTKIPAAWIDRFEDESGKFYEQGEDSLHFGWREGFDGKQYWFVSLYQGQLWHLGDSVAKRRRYNLAHVGILREFPSGNPATEVIGAALVNGSRAVVVRVPFENGSALYYFDGQSGLLVRSDIPLRWRRYGYEGKELKASNDRDWGLLDTCSYQQYEPDGQSKVLFAHNIECNAGGYLRTFRVTKVDVNTPVDPKLFNEP